MENRLLLLPQPLWECNPGMPPKKVGADSISSRIPIVTFTTFNSGWSKVDLNIVFSESAPITV